MAISGIVSCFSHLLQHHSFYICCRIYGTLAGCLVHNLTGLAKHVMPVTLLLHCTMVEVGGFVVGCYLFGFHLHRSTGIWCILLLPYGTKQACLIIIARLVGGQSSRGQVSIVTHCRHVACERAVRCWGVFVACMCITPLTAASRLLWCAVHAGLPCPGVLPGLPLQLQRQMSQPVLSTGMNIHV